MILHADIAPTFLEPQKIDRLRKYESEHLYSASAEMIMSAFTFREVVKKIRIFYGQADRKGWPPPPPPPYGQVICVFFGGVHLTSVYDYT